MTGHPDIGEAIADLGQIARLALHAQAALLGHRCSALHISTDLAAAQASGANPYGSTDPEHAAFWDAAKHGEFSAASPAEVADTPEEDADAQCGASGEPVRVLTDVEAGLITAGQKALSSDQGLAEAEASPANPYGSSAELEVNERGWPTGNYVSPYTAASAAGVAQCGVTVDAIGRSFRCERPVGHSGPHAADQGPGVPPVEWVKIADDPASAAALVEGVEGCKRPGCYYLPMAVTAEGREAELAHHLRKHHAAEVAEGVDVPVYEWNGDLQCETRNPRGFICTRTKGHGFNHAALFTSGDLIHSWPQEPGPCPAQWGEPPETMLCSLPSGHDGNHATAERIEWGGRWETAEPGVQLPGKGSMDSLCPATIPSRHGEYICTLDAGHAGQHEAHGASPLPVWHDGDADYSVEVEALVRGEEQ
jgi:hypothetical protein